MLDFESGEEKKGFGVSSTSSTIYAILIFVLPYLAMPCGAAGVA
jgi:hypothetical protein